VFETYTLSRSERVEVDNRNSGGQFGQPGFTVLDGLAQAYKTPLTAILAASAGLSEIGRLSSTQADLVALIDEQARLLSQLTTQLLTTARLDGKEAEVHLRRVGVEPIIDDALAGLKTRLAKRKVVVDLEDDSLVLFCDRQLILMLLTQYIDNACKYATAGTAITIRAVRVNSEVVFSVHNFGPLIPVADRESIFDHYSLPAFLANRTASAGFGLAVAKRIASVHGGRVWLVSGEATGTSFFAAIPAPLQKGCSS
jgi:two-component system sensor histidine kinase KdpD